MEKRLFILLIALLAIVTGAKAQKIDPIDTKPTLTLEMYSGEKLTKEQIIVAKFIAKKAELTVKANLLDNTDMFFQDEKTLFSIGNGKLNLGTVVVPTDVTWEYNIRPISLSKTDMRLLAEAGITGTYAYIALNISVTINKTNFTDETFRTYVSDNFDKNINNKGRLTEAEANAVKEIAVSEKGITSLKGVEYFTKLEKLDCSINPLTELDVTHNTELKELICNGNWIESNPNQLTRLDVSKNTALQILNCGQNKLTALDVSKNTALISLIITNNDIEALDVSNNTALTRLICYANNLKELDVSYNTELTDLQCSSNLLTELDVSNNKELKELLCHYCQLTMLNVSGCTKLERLYCYNNQLTTLDVSGFTALSDLELYNNQLTTLDVSGCTALTQLYCDKGGNDELTMLNATGCTSMEYLFCSNKQLTTLDVSGCTALKWLNCYNNKLTSLDVSGCTALTSLYCYNNQLTSLDVSGCTALSSMYCYNNQLTSLDVSGCTALNRFECCNNKIRGAAMTALVESLPGDRTNAEIRVYKEPEGNLITPLQVAVATGKGWKVKNHDGSNWVDYLGESVPADANGDGEVTAADVETISDYILGRLAPDSWFDEESADLVDDGVVDIQDLTQLIKLLTE